MNRETFASLVEVEAERDLKAAFYIWIRWIMGSHVLLEFDRIDEDF